MGGTLSSPETSSTTTPFLSVRLRLPSTQVAPPNLVYNSEQNLVNTNYSNRCVVITGPNASGKTVYMKQLAVIIYLAHCGLFVPTTFA